MINPYPRCLIVAFLSLFAVQLLGQTPAVSRPRPALSTVAGGDGALVKKLIEQYGDGRSRTRNPASPQLPVPTGSHTQTPASTSVIIKTPALASARTITAQPHGAVPLDAPACNDTTAHILTTETNDFLAPDFITLTRDGNILVPGFRLTLNTPYYNYPYLMKQTPQGDIVWAKSFTSFGVSPRNTADCYKCFELRDGTLLLIGDLDIPKPFNGTRELVIWHLDANGNVLWQQTDSSTLWQQNSGSFYVAGMTQDQVGNIFLAGTLYALGALPSHTFILKIDGSGNILWDQSFPGTTQCYGLFWAGGQLSMVGTNYDDNNTTYLWNMKLDPGTGLMLSKKAWQANYGSNSVYNMFIGWGTVQLLSNGNISVSGTALSDLVQTSDIVHGIVAEFDPDFNFLRGWMLKSNVQSNYDNTRFTQHPSGRISYSYLQYISSYDEDIFYGAIEQGQIIKERVFHGRGRADAWTSNFLNVSPNQDIVLQEYSSISPTTTQGDEFVRLHDSDTSSVCSGKDSSASWVEPYSMKSYANPYWYTTYSNTFRHTIHSLPLPVAGTPVQQTACKVAASCNAIQVVVDQAQVCAGSPATFTLLRNPGCGAWPLWNFDTTNIQSCKMLNDTTLQLIYRDQFQGAITASLNGACSHLSDAKGLTVLPGNKPISLGANAWLCPDSTLVLRPATGYSGYLWQDGSVADTLLVTNPGTYSVTVTNTCGTPMNASVQVQQAPLYDFSVGSDITTCLDIPVVLQAPDGYLNYSWTSVADGSTYSAQVVTVNPAVNTRYVAMAKSSLGCTVKSTIDVTVNVPLPVHLGNDTSICKGDSLLLDAGADFTRYLWNNGETTETIFVHQTGAYSVKARSPNGCYGSDTLQVVKLYPLPTVTLNPNTSLCEGTSRILDAGAGYSSYAWQDGSSASTLTIETMGTYWVQVKDNNGCSGSDTVAITQIRPNPHGFLVPDTVICNNYPSTIGAIGSFDSYVWSSGETTGHITVKQAGNYSLTVTDDHGCSATEDIAITTRQCLLGIYFPNAFTPDAGGANGIYRPYVLGNMIHYHLQLFNRYGQLVFTTEDYTRGWDGRVNGAMQPTGTYVWMCQYQFGGETGKMEKGTLLLIR